MPGCPETDKVNVFNLGFNGYVELNDSIAIICKSLGVTPKLEFSGGDRGWIGDNPFIYLDVARIAALGWNPKFSIPDGILRTLHWLQANAWVYEKRS